MANDFDFVIIGAGLAGLKLGELLKSKNRNLILLEKSKGLGGRCATRRTEFGPFNHGAQFIKIEKAQQKSYFDLNICPDVLFEDDTLQKRRPHEGLSQIAKSFQKNNLSIQLNHTVEKIIQQNSFFKVEGKISTGDSFSMSCQNVVLTAPLPQSLILLKNSNISYNLDLEKTTYAKALVALVTLKEQLSFKHKEHISNDIFSISEQCPPNENNFRYTIVFSENFSENYFELSEEELFKCLQTQVIKFLTENKSHFSKNSTDDILYFEAKKWRYSHPFIPRAEPYHKLGHLNLYLIGDAFQRGSLNGALQSAQTLFDSIN